MALSSEHGFPYCLSLSRVLQGWALAEQGRSEEGIAQMLQGVADYRATAAELNQPYLLALLAETYGKTGRAGEALALVTEVLTAVQKNGQHFYEAELYRLKGELLLSAERGRE
jgi:predicted ATPase